MRAREQDLQTAELEHTQDIKEMEAIAAAALKERQHVMHRSGKQRARTVSRGGVELEVESDSELEDDERPASKEHGLDDILKAEAVQEQYTEAVTVSGERLSVEAGLNRVLGALRSLGTCDPMTLGDIEHHTNIRLLDPANEGFKKRLCESSGVAVICDPRSELSLKAAAPLGVECKDDLIRLFTSLIPQGKLKSLSGRPAYAVSEEEIDGAYAELSMDLDHLIAEGVLSCYTEDSRHRWRILFPAMPFAATSASDEEGKLRAMWKACPFPKTEAELKESAILAGVRPLLRLNVVYERNKLHRKNTERFAALQRRPPKRSHTKNVPILLTSATTKPGGSFADVEQ